MSQDRPEARPAAHPGAPPRALPEALRTLRSGWTGWLSGIAFFVALGLACVDRVPWGLSLLPLMVLAGFLAVRSWEEWPRVGFPVCILGVGLFVAATGLFKTGIDWSRQWDALRNAGAVDAGAGVSPVLGTALAVLLGGGFLAVVFLHFESIRKALVNMRLAVVTLASVGILSILGTMVVQRFGAGGLPEPEKQFVEKFMKGQGAVPVNAWFLLAPPEVAFSAAEQERIEMLGKAFGEGKARQMRLRQEKMHSDGEKALAIEKHLAGRREPLLRLFERLDALGFTTVFRTWWFNSLLVLLAVQIVSLLVHRYPWGWPKAGWVTTHVGVLVVLAGCVISDGFLRDGSLALAPGQFDDCFEETTRLDVHGKAQRTPLGYRVAMLGTDQSFYHELQIAFPGVKAGNDVLWTQEQLRPGRVIPVNDPEGKASYEVRIVDVHERALLETGMVSGGRTGRPGGVPALHLQFLATGPGHEAHAHGDGGHLVEEGWITAGGPEGESVRYFVVASEEEGRRLLEGAGSRSRTEGKHGTLSVTVPGVPEPVSVPATPGAKAVIPGVDGASWTVEVKRFHPRFTVETARHEEKGHAGIAPGDGDGPATNPVLVVEVLRTASDGSEEAGTTYVFGNPSLQSLWQEMATGAEEHGGEAPSAGERRIGKGPPAACTFAFGYAPLLRTWIVEGPGVERTLVFHRLGEAPRTHPLASPGSEAPVPDRDLTLRLVEAIPDAVPDLRITPLAQESDEEYIETCLRTLQTGHPPPETVSAAKLEVREKDDAGERTRTEWLVAEKKGVVEPRTFRSTDGRLFLVMTETQNSLMFRSALEVQAPDGKPVPMDGRPYRTVVRVNRPLVWGGYAFYQNSFNAASGGMPAMSVFRVKYDRGIPLVYSGFVILVLGVVVMLYFDPLFKRRRNVAVVESAGAAGEA